MKYYPVFLFVFILSCTKQKQEKVNYKHWYKIDAVTSDTLFSVYIANCFTPNGDGINDVFIPKGDYVLNEMKIFDKNSKEIFKTNDRYKGWNGKINSSLETVYSGNYTFQLNIYDIHENEERYTGSVLLLK